MRTAQAAARGPHLRHPSRRHVPPYPTGPPSARHLRATSDANGLRVDYAGRVARIARVYQDGGVDRAKRGGALVRYARRQLLGLSDIDRKQVGELLLSHLTGKGVR
ncbi:phage virion morphogenesis protein [Lysobacter gummosus]|uniref:phage virion morphogenesis protein n=1 Tax=Lysobacter gummosus TaxID=262324 RepID=UPI003631CB7F